MAILQTIEQDFKTALKDKLALQLSVLRMLKSAIKNQAINDKTPEAELSEAVILAVIRKELKKRQDSIASFESGNRLDLAEQEKAEAAILSQYAPAQMSAQDIEKIVDEIVATGLTNFGQIMKEVMQKTQGQADGQVVQAMVKAKLAN